MPVYKFPDLFGIVRQIQIAYCILSAYEFASGKQVESQQPLDIRLELKDQPPSAFRFYRGMCEIITPLP